MKEKAAELLAISGSILLVLNALFNEAFAADTSKAPAKGVAKATLRTPTKAPGVDSIDTYIKLVSPKIQQAWKAPEKTTAQKVIVSLSIEQSGKIKSVTIKEPSGDQAFDDATIASLSALGQLPPMPASAKDGMTLNYTFNAGNRNQSTKADNDSYINAFSRKVNAAWRNPKVDKNCKVSIAITVDQSGKLVKAEVAKSSGVKIVDDAGLHAAKLAEPYPAIPASLGDKMTVTFTFEAGPTKDLVNKMKFNGVPLPQGDYQISSGGAQLRPLEVDTAVNRKLQEREAQVQERLFNLKNALDQQVSKAGAQSIQAAKAHHELANCAVELHDYKEAEENYKTALPIVESDTSQAAELHSLLHDYAQMYVTISKLKDAEPLMTRALEIGKTSSGIDAQKQRKVMEDYARLLYKLNRTAEADGIYKQLRETH
jgi:TonB family protein